MKFKLKYFVTLLVFWCVPQFVRGFSIDAHVDDKYLYVILRGKLPHCSGPLLEGEAAERVKQKILEKIQRDALTMVGNEDELIGEPMIKFFCGIPVVTRIIDRPLISQLYDFSQDRERVFKQISDKDVAILGAHLSA